jgi:hypothetical protein
MTTSVEVWKPVVGYEGLYEVSNQGRVRSLRRGKVLSTTPNKHLGYVAYHLRRAGAVQSVYAHSLVLETFVALRPSKDYQACHRNGDRADNRVENLRWGTRVENYEDARRHGTNSKGRRHGSAKLTEQDVLAIRADPRLHREIASAYGISRSRVSTIKSRKDWAWLP